MVMTLMLSESQCIKTVFKNAYVCQNSQVAFSFPRNFHSLNPVLLLKHWCLSLALNKFYNKLAKSYTKEDDNVLLEIPRQI